MRGLEIRKRVCFSPLLYYTTYKCKHILLKASSHFDLSLLQKKKKKGPSKTLVFTEKWYLWYSCQDYHY